MSLSASLITSPQSYSVVNAVNGSGMWFQAQSASCSLPNFKYVFDLYQLSLTSSQVVQNLGQFPEPPRPYNNISGLIGTGLFNPYKTLRSVIGNQPDFPINIGGVSTVTASYVNYALDYGFSYDPGFTFSTHKLDLFGVDVLQLEFAAPTDILVNDVVTLNMITSLYNPQYNTTTRILSVNAGLTAAITTTLYGATPSNPSQFEIGEIVNLKRISGTTSNFYAWNGTRQYQEANDNFVNEFVVRNTPGNWLTDYLIGVSATDFTQLKPTNLGQYETLGFISDPSIPINNIYIDLWDVYGDFISSTTHSLTMSYPSRKYEFGVGTQNLIEQYGVSFSGIGYYKIYLANGSSTTPGASVARRINFDCNYCFYDVVQLTFLNRRGSYEYYTFNKDSKRSVTTTKNEWMTNMPWNYQQGDRINSVLSQKIEINYTINSDWVSQYDQNWLEELLTSPEAYVIDGTDRIPIYILDQEWISKTVVRDQLFNVTVTYKMAFPLISQDN